MQLLSLDSWSLNTIRSIYKPSRSHFVLSAQSRPPKMRSLKLPLPLMNVLFDCASAAHAGYPHSHSRWFMDITGVSLRATYSVKRLGLEIPIFYCLLSLVDHDMTRSQSNPQLLWRCPKRRRWQLWPSGDRSRRRKKAKRTASGSWTSRHRAQGQRLSLRDESNWSGNIRKSEDSEVGTNVYNCEKKNAYIFSKRRQSQTQDGVIESPLFLRLKN